MGHSELVTTNKDLSGFLVIVCLHGSSHKDQLAEWVFSVPITHIFLTLKNNSGDVLATDCKSVMDSENILDGFCCHLVAEDMCCYVNPQWMEM